jgi:transposase InsO family protein
MKYAWIERNKLRWPVCVQCRVLEVSASGYRQHLARKKKILTRRHLSETALLVEIRAVYTEARGAYGWPRVWRQLKARGVRVGKRRVERTMRQNGIRGRGKRRFRVSTTDSNHALPIAPNLLARNFTVARANTVWVGDMTYIPTGEGWLYLAVVLDLFSRRIVGWAMGEAITAELACRALDMARYSRLPAGGLIFHSDRGSQYASRRYTDLLAGHGIKASMSRKGNCWDNACSESLFGSLKVERLHGMDFQNHREAKDATLDWLLWYNGSRMHSTLRYLSPAQFEQQAINLRPALAA